MHFYSVVRAEFSLTTHSCNSGPTSTSLLAPHHSGCCIAVIRVHRTVEARLTDMNQANSAFAKVMLSAQSYTSQLRRLSGLACSFDHDVDCLEDTKRASGHVCSIAETSPFQTTHVVDTLISHACENTSSSGGIQRGSALVVPLSSSSHQPPEL